MRWLKNNILPFIARHSSTTGLIRYAGADLIFPFYHTVSDEYLPHIHPLYRPKTTKEFYEDLDLLLKYFQPVDIDTVYSHCSGIKTIVRPSFHLSFDDGLRGIYDIVTPILYKKGIPFTVFVNSDFVDNRNLFFRHREALEVQSIDPDAFLNEKRPYLSTVQLKEMQRKGVHIGAHSTDHAHYNFLEEKQQISRTLESCAFVKKVFEQKLTTFAFPFTDTGISDSFFEAVYPVVDLTFGISGIYFRHNGRHIGRIDMEKYGCNARECINKALLVKKYRQIWNSSK
ncbi:MAG: polysaccharide deacetylase family protein [Dysgonamonadaceae bacterium]|jgi:peptidoglycan/xylan/chitin deacetylase (PgdA/CDA1 family)|nr:polysaccharide deacetylase family protein [Dysgonamonadaceae bacterium]